MKRSLFLLLFLCTPNWLYAYGIADTKYLDSFLRNLKTLQAQFEQKIYNENNTLLEHSQGKMYVQRPNKFRWVYQKPYNQLIVADGERVWIYESDLDQVTVKNLNKALGKTPAFLLSRNRKVDKDFWVRKLRYRKGLMRFELTPKDTQAAFQKMIIKLGRRKTLAGFELVDNLGQKSYINFTRVRRNQRLDRSFFIFTPPAGADIINDL